MNVTTTGGKEQQNDHTDLKPNVLDREEDFPCMGRISDALSRVCWKKEGSCVCMFKFQVGSMLRINLEESNSSINSNPLSVV
jgi:hypothetical protein